MTIIDSNGIITSFSTKQIVYMFFTPKRYVRAIYHRIKRPLLWLLFIIYQALVFFPSIQKKYHQFLANYPSIQHNIESKKELIMIFPYLPKSSQELSVDARKLYDGFLQSTQHNAQHIPKKLR